MTSKCVLTGDFIDSTEASEESLTLAMAALEHCADASSALYSRHRGDGWQIYLRRDIDALRLTIRILARLKLGKSALKTRISIGLGDATVPDNDLSAGHGRAFELSGRGLDHMPARQSIAIAGDQITPLHQAVLSLCEEIADRWSQEQARAIFHAIGPEAHSAPPTHQTIADQLGITRQAAQERLSRAGYNALNSALTAWESENA